jgi:Xaa-Pro aminopeptidase
MLDRGEVEWLNTYHRRVAETLSPRLDADTRKWLNSVARAI